MSFVSLVPEARAGLDRISTSRPRRRRDSSRQNIHVAAAAAPRLVTKIRGVAAIHQRKIRAADVRRSRHDGRALVRVSNFPVDVRVDGVRRPLREELVDVDDALARDDALRRHAAPKLLSEVRQELCLHVVARRERAVAT